MEALQVFPVVIANIPSEISVDMIYKHIFYTLKLKSKYMENLIFYSPKINTNQTWLLVFGNSQSCFDIIHDINKSPVDIYRLSASIPSEPYLEQKPNKSHLKGIGLMKNFVYHKQKLWKSYSFRNCLAIQISQKMGYKWLILPVNQDRDRWHLIICAKAELKQKMKQLYDLTFYPITSNHNFSGLILNETENAKNNDRLKNFYQNESIGLLYNKLWNVDHIFELKKNFKLRHDVLKNKKAIFRVRMSHKVINSTKNSKKMNKSIFDYIKPDLHCYAMDVRIDLNQNKENVNKNKSIKVRSRISDGDNVKQQQQSKKRMIRKRNRKPINYQTHISRLIDVRLWTVNEMKQFLKIVVDGKYNQKFVIHNVKGKRFEYITVNLLKYLSIPSDDAAEIIKHRDFFLDWLSLYISFNLMCSDLVYKSFLYSVKKWFKNMR